MEHEEMRDPLLGCLEIICKLHKHSFSAAQAKAGLPLVEGMLTPSLMSRAAEQIGFSAKVQKVAIKNIPKIEMPVILIMKNNNACVLNRCMNGNGYELIFGDSDGGTKVVSEQQVNDEYEGYAIFIQPEYEYEHRTEEFNVVDKRSWFWSTIYKYKSIYMHVLVAAFLTNLFVLVAPLFIMNVYDRVVPNEAMVTLWVLAFGAFVFFVFDLAARILRHYLVDVSGEKADIELSRKMFKHMLGLRMSNRPESAGAIASYFNEFEILREFFTSASFVALIDLPFIILFIFVVWVIGGPIVWIPLIAGPLVLIVAWLLEIPTRRAMQKALVGASLKQALLVESINGIESIKSMTAEGLMQRRWEESVERTAEAAKVSRFYSALTMNFTVWMQQLVVIAIVVFGVYLIIDGQMSIGGLIAVTILGGRAMMLNQVASLLSRIERSRTALRGLNHIMGLPTDRSIKEKFIRKPHLKGDIKIENLGFYYPGERVAALEGVNLVINQGERVGIVGRVGSGKSTLLKTIVGLYEPRSGVITIDGVDNMDIDPIDLRRNVHYVSDDSVLFYGSVRDNIAMGNPYASDEEILHAAKVAGVEEFVRKHPAGFDLQVGERGQNLSAGQRQAVALARSFLGNPCALLLDEPTSSVDNNFEQKFMKMLPEYVGDKTLIIVTHRSSLLELVDRVIVLESGRVVADGPTETIMSKLSAGNPKPSANA